MSHCFVKLNGIDVPFPFEPYQLQKAYMSQIIRSAKHKKNALLESPTGTGKTASLLCSSLAWLNYEINSRIQRLRDREELLMNSAESGSDESIGTNENIQNGDTLNQSFFEFHDEKKPRIYFSSRTHSQLSQSIKELKKSNFSSNSAVVLAGRDVLCLNEEVQKMDCLSSKNQACQSKIGKKNCSCPFYKDIEKRIQLTSDYSNNLILDVEDLITLGKKHQICPYFASRIVQRTKDVTFLPYNYLIDPLIRKGQPISCKNSMIIFDEGHNIERTCEEAFSFDLISEELVQCSDKFDLICRYYQECLEKKDSQKQEILDLMKDLNGKYLIEIKAILDGLKTQIDLKTALFLQDSGKTKGDVVENDWIFRVLDICNLSVEKIKHHAEICDKIQRFLYCLLSVKGSNAAEAASSLNCIRNLLCFLDAIFPENSIEFEAFKEEFKKKFKIFIRITMDVQTLKSATEQISNQNQRTKSILHIWCLSPSIGLKTLMKSNVRSVVLTSGTLAPMNSFESEFEIKFDCKIQNPHIIKRSQMAIYPVSESYGHVRLDSTFGNKNNIDYYQALGDTIIDICTNVPDGVLIFFQSYAVMNNSIKKWKDNERKWKIWSKLNQLKPVHYEVKLKEEFNEVLKNYRTNVDKGKGAAFFAICRGKLSEGIDLGGVYSRAVILVGLPYPSVQDPRVKLKKIYLDTVKHQDYTSNNWYSLQMKRALNQAIGRAIRHKNDYGCVFLLDYRFVNQTKDLSRWCREFVRNPPTYHDMIVEIKEFFSQNISEESKNCTVELDKENEAIDQDENNNMDSETESPIFNHLDNVNLRQGQKRLLKIDLNKKVAVKKAKREDEFEQSNQKTKRRHIAIEYETDSSVVNDTVIDEDFDPIVIFDE